MNADQNPNHVLIRVHPCISGLKWFCLVFGMVLIHPSVLFAQIKKTEKPEDYMILREGTLPILLSAPHGGRMPIKDATVRKGVGVTQFVTGPDMSTDDLALKIAELLEKRFGAKPYLVIAKFERKYADANRTAAHAYESEAAKPVYELYHSTLTKYRDTIKKDFTSGLVLDIHGQGGEVNTIFRGTNGGKSVKHLIDRHGDQALTGPKSLFGQLASHDILIFPTIGSKDKEDSRYNGGYIVQTYGSSDGGNVDAIQLEFGTNLRQKTKIEATAKAAADSIAVFVEEFLDVKKK
ncbi:hypothetical protein BH11PLA2_BH11PLA2_30340 [soil metagenome]